MTLSTRSQSVGKMAKLDGYVDAWGGGRGSTERRLWVTESCLWVREKCLVGHLFYYVSRLIVQEIDPRHGCYVWSQNRSDCPKNGANLGLFKIKFSKFCTKIV